MMSGPVQGVLFATPGRDPRLRVGPAGWNYPDWVGTAYPTGASSKFDHLGYLADYFDTVEINSSFYAPPKPADAARWASRVRKNPRFRFTAKAWQRLTHGKRDPTDAGIDADCDAVRRSLSPIADAGLLGAVLLQFPWSFRCVMENMAYLELLFSRLKGWPLVLEVRHATWNEEQVFAFLREWKVGFCNIDQPVIGQSLKPGAVVTATVGYFRLHGRNYQNWFKEDAGRDARYDYLYSREEIHELSGLIRKVRNQAEETYAITNNHFRGQALVNAIQILEEIDGVPPAVPPPVLASYKGLGTGREGQ